MEKLIQIYIEKLKDLGLKATPQRISILKYLDGNQSHPTVDDIYQNLLKDYPSISLATVYNTVQSLVNSGQLSELSIQKGKNNYDPDISQHIHSYCTECGLISDVFNDTDKTPYLLDDGFQIHTIQKVYYGICADCAKRRAF